MRRLRRLCGGVLAGGDFFFFFFALHIRGTGDWEKLDMEEQLDMIKTLV